MKKIKSIIPILIILIFCLSTIPKFFNSDLYFDLKTGESILKNGIDFLDHFSFINGLTYMYHHWLYDIVIYYIYVFFENNGLFVLFYLFFSFTILSVYFVNKKRTNNVFVSTIIALFTSFICSYAFTSRVQTITYFLFFIEIYLLEMLYKSESKRYSVLLFMVSITICNFHLPLWIFSIILFLPYILECLIYQLKRTKHSLEKISDKIKVEKPKNIRMLLITFVLMILSGFISPLKFYPYTFFTKSLFNESFLFIAEMSKTVVYYFKWEIGLIILCVFVFLLKNVKIKIRDLGIIIGLFLFSLIATRNVIYFYLICPTILIKILCDSNVKFKFDTKKFQKFINKINKTLVTCFVVIALCFVFIYLIIKMDFQNYDYGVKDSYPVETVKYIKSNLDYEKIVLYNDFNYGSYIEFFDIPVFIDNRAEVYIKEYNGGIDVLGDYLKVSKINEWKKVFDKYKFTHALAHKKSSIYYFLKESSEYKIIFEEENYALYEKNQVKQF